MTDPHLTHVLAILDRSGSMAPIARDIEGGFDAFIGEQAAQPGRCLVTLYRFDDVVERVFASLPVDQVRPLSLAPRGTTALYDAVGRAVVELGEHLSGLPEEQRPGQVVVAIMTDGGENASREWTSPRVRELIAQQEQTYGWTFLFMGAGQDAYAEAAHVGIDPTRAVLVGRSRGAQAYAATSRLVTQLRNAPDARPDVGYSPTTRQELLDEG